LEAEELVFVCIRLDAFGELFVEVVGSFGGADEGELAVGGGHHGAEDFVDDFAGDEGGFVDGDVVGFVSAQVVLLSGASCCDGVVSDGDFHVAVSERGDVDELLEPEVFVKQAFDEADDSFVDHLRLGLGGGDDELAAWFVVGQFAEDLDGAGVGFAPSASAGEDLGFGAGE